MGFGDSAVMGGCGILLLLERFVLDGGGPIEALMTSSVSYRCLLSVD